MKHPLLNLSPLLVLLVFGCSSPTQPGPNSNPILRFDRVDPLHPGEPTRIHGTGFLSGIPGMTLDQVPVNPSILSDTEASFTVPTLRSCETDGRAVEIRAGNASLSSSLDLRDTVDLAIGESHIIDVQVPRCFALPANGQEYVLTALALDPESATALPLVQVQTWTGAGGSPAPAPTAFVSPRPTLIPGTPKASLPPLRNTRANSTPVPFDPRYPTAQVGDTLRFVDWNTVFRNEGHYSHPCLVPRNQAPSYPVEVVAVAGHTVIAVDLRAANAPVLTNATNRGRAQRAATLADAVLIPTMQHVFDPDYTPPPGAGERYFHILARPSDLGGASGTTESATAWSQNECPLSSEMVTTLSPALERTTDEAVRSLANTLIHEYAHMADRLTVTRRTGRTSAGSTGWQTEAWAVNAEETAARLSSGQNLAARPSLLDASSPFSNLGLSYLWAAHPETSPWSGAGAYETGAAILLWAREQKGETSTHANPRLFLALADANDWSLRRLASETGTDTDTFLDLWALAWTTDDLIDPKQATAQHLPQIITWDNHEPGLSQRDAIYHHPSRRASRVQPVQTTLTTTGGNVAALYFPSENSRGISLVVSSPSQPGPRSRIRLTRLQ